MNRFLFSAKGKQLRSPRGVLWLALRGRFSAEAVHSAECEFPHHGLLAFNDRLRSMDGMSDDALPVLAVVRDLMFVSKITGAAKAHGAVVKIIRDPAKLAGESGRLLIVDLNLAGAIEAASAWLASSRVPSIGFVSHVDAETARQARDAGIGTVMARSHFVDVLKELFAES